MDRRTLLLGALGGASALALAGCAGTLPAIRAGSSFGEGASGRVRVWCRAATQAGLTTLVSRFNAAQSGLTVELTPVPDAQYVTKLATAIRGGDPPDVVDIDDINSQLFIFRDVFADLTEPVKQLPYRDSLSTGHLRLLTNEGRYYGLPYLADNSMLFVNTRLLERAGVSVEDATADLDSLLAAARAVSKLGGEIRGWSIAGNSPGILGFVTQPHVWASGTDLIAGDVGSQHGNIVGNDALEGMLELYRALWTDGVLSRSAYSDSGTTWGADYRAGTVGIMPTNYASVVLSGSEAIRDATRTILIPDADGKRSFFDGGDNMCIPNGAANPGGGWRFMLYANGIRQQQALPEGGYFPTRADAATPAYRTRYPLATAPLDAIDRGYAPRTLAYNLLVNQPSAPYFTMFREAVFGDGVQAAMKAAQPEYDRILEQAQT